MNRAEKAALQLRAVDVGRMLRRRGPTTNSLRRRSCLRAISTTDTPTARPSRYRSRARSSTSLAGALAEELDARIRVDDEGIRGQLATVFDQLLPRSGRPGRGHNGFGLERPDVVLTAATDGDCSRPRSRATTASGVPTRKAKDRRRGVHRGPPATPVRNRTHLLSARLRDRSGRIGTGRRRPHRSGETRTLLTSPTPLRPKSPAFALIAAGEDGIRRACERTDALIGSLVSV